MTEIFNGSIETALTLTVKKYLFGIPLIPSLLCSMFIFISAIYNRNLRRRTNRIMLLIIFVDFIELLCDLVPISLYFFATGHVYSLSVCHYWASGNYLLQGISSWLMGWASIDRYLLIFHSQIRDTVFRHELPIIILCTFVTIWYIVLTLTYTCTKTWVDGQKFLCGGPCFDAHISMVTADWILIVLLPTLAIVIFNALLLIRVLIQKCHRLPGATNRSFAWRQNRKLIIQLLSIIIVYAITQCPLAIFSIIRLLGPSNFLIDVSLIWLFYTPYLIYLIVPFAYVATTKECQRGLSTAYNRVTTVFTPVRIATN